MASFTDSIQNFTPYQQELPVDTLVNTGLFKENQYQEGVKEIQGQIDTVASLPLAKKESKQYMNLKLNQLKDSLSGSLASDFSDQRIINQVGGTARQIAA